MKQNNTSIPTFIGLAFLIGALVIGLLFIGSRTIFKIGASPEFAPKDLRVTNITDTSFTVSWVTDSQSVGFVKYGASQGAIEETAPDEIGGSSTTHFATIKGLRAQTSYYFLVNSHGADFDSNGAPWTASTGPALANPESTIIISGSVKGENGTLVDKGLVYAQVANGSPLSAITNAEGNWLITLSFSRDSATLGSYAPIDKNTLIEIFAQDGSAQMASAKVYPGAANPTPPIILGQVHDFTAVTPGQTGDSPTASLGLPDDQTASSKFNVTESTVSATTETVTLKSLTEGEIVSTTKPQFFGEGPAGVVLTITIESDPITQSVTVPSSGDWQLNLTSALPPGNHKITINWRDATGILRTLTRNFVVQASEGPSFEASTSASTTPTPSPTTIATASATPIPTPTLIATGSAVPMPVSGSLTPTISLFILSIGVILFSMIIASKVF